MTPRTVAPPIELFFFFNDTATTEIYTLSLHDALPISVGRLDERKGVHVAVEALAHLPSDATLEILGQVRQGLDRSEEHTSELQSRSDIVCRLLLEKKKNIARHVTPDRV